MKTEFDRLEFLERELGVEIVSYELSHGYLYNIINQKKWSQRSKKNIMEFYTLCNEADSGYVIEQTPQIEWI